MNFGWTKKNVALKICNDTEFNWIRKPKEVEKSVTDKKTSKKTCEPKKTKKSSSKKVTKTK